MARMLAIVATVAAASGCTGSRNVYVRYGDIHRHLGELRASGHASVEATDRDATDSSRVNNVTMEQDEATSWTLRLAEVEKLAEGCGDVAPFRGGEAPDSSCVLETDRDHVMLVGRHRDRIRGHDVVAFTFGMATLGLAGGAIYCGLECESSKSGKTLGMAGGALLSLLVWAVASGGRD